MTTTGKRIGAERKLAGLKQIQLAQRTNYSLSMVRAVEQGREPASPAFIAAAARVLRVEPERLTGVPYYAEIEADGGQLEGLTELRALIAEGPYAQGVEPPTLAELTAEIAAIDRDCRDDKSRAALARLPVHMRQLYGALHEAGSAERGAVHNLLCAAYAAAERLCRRFGYMGLAVSALDRLEWFAAQADDPMYAAVGRIKRARILMYHNANDIALTIIDKTLDTITGDDAAANEVRGFGHLCGSIIAARGFRPDVARNHITEARTFARRIKGESDMYGTMFGPANVEIHSCAVELESGDPGKAAHEGTALALPAGIALPRAGHHWQDVARAWLLIGQPDKALHSLNLARGIAPQQTRLHPSVRETLHGIASAQRRQSETLVSFASWAGVAL
ncbi:helix-turn-helix domain-containing protein [Nocardia wallacei]|uniref:helix-turn-helix domain-containing protein n=1 Tax=Nocardia wallacei TaxID=480035 RepID=UPI002456BF52|nr:helix-turn-helix domain-containing protein [Nocardia wallacei]